MQEISYEKLILTNLGARYLEAVDYLYSSNIFETHDARVLEYLSLLVLPQRINPIRSLVFTWRFERYPPISQHVDLAESHYGDHEIRKASWTKIRRISLPSRTESPSGFHLPQPWRNRV